MDSYDDRANKSYALSGRIMLSAIIILFFVVIMMVCLHLYARWYLLNARRRQLRRARNRRAHLVFYADPANPNGAVQSRGLDSTVMKSLPVFVYSGSGMDNPVECAVCLSEFEEGETGRVLPKCKHSFHIECIDMWFHSHSTCPLCRNPVEPVPENPDTELETVVTQSGSGEQMPSTSSLRVEIPGRNVFEGEPGSDMTAYRSPMRRMLSFRRILSRERRGNGNATSPSCGGESDIERGETQGKHGGDSVV
ncbi:RING/U-box superfamily protein [Euphorbia peplus]|nr:RING/U-box superfamily protein [Euphorbia peplus]